jgi:anti-sigma regulatory factor (Ser/Thr protein kinase)
LFDPVVIEARESSAIGAVRRSASTLGTRAGFGDDDNARLALVVTELGTNLIKHAAGGRFLLRRCGDGSTIEILAMDNGPGIESLAEALRDGHSTTGTSGTGLGAVGRQADFFQVYSQRKQGTTCLARLSATRGSLCAAPSGAVSIAFPGETVNGDSWAERSLNGRRLIMVVDGLGHGGPAHEASAKAEKCFQTATGSVSAILTAIHQSLRGTRGAAVAIAELDVSNATVKFAGIGNISATIIDAGARRSAVSLYGIVGHQMREAREYSYPWSAGSTLIMHSDGLTTRWDLDRYPGLLSRDPVLIAAVLWKDHHRQSDDSTVVVAHAT